MPEIHESTPCPQYGDQAEFNADWTGRHRTTCLSCGYHERESFKFDADGIRCAFRRDISKGFGVLRGIPGR